MKIYTKTGDQGTTGLLSGTRVPKHHIRLESYGTVDELNSWLGLLRDALPEHPQSQFLMSVQNHLFAIGSHLAVEPGKANFELPKIEESDVEAIEKQIDAMNAVLPPLRNFILPGGHPAVSQIHVARTVCRRAERCVSHLAETTEVSGVILRFINRLSDYLFVLSRLISKEKDAIETPWTPRK